MSNKLIILFLMASTAFFSSFAVPSEDQSIKKKLGIVKENIFKEKQKRENLITIRDFRFLSSGRTQISNGSCF